MTTSITNDEDIIDTRELIARIEDLESMKAALEEDVENATTQVEASDATRALNVFAQDEGLELKLLLDFASECETLRDYHYGETLIRETYFTTYIERLIDECYPMPEGFDSGNWPFSHMKFDFEGAAEEAKIDYTCIEFDGVTYYARG
jgi:hypothetical protein